MTKKIKGQYVTVQSEKQKSPEQKQNMTTRAVKVRGVTTLDSTDETVNLNSQQSNLYTRHETSSRSPVRILHRHNEIQSSTDGETTTDTHSIQNKQHEKDETKKQTVTKVNNEQELEKEEVTRNEPKSQLILSNNQEDDNINSTADKEQIKQLNNSNQDNHQQGNVLYSYSQNHEQVKQQMKKQDHVFTEARDKFDVHLAPRQKIELGLSRSRVGAQSYKSRTDIKKAVDFNKAEIMKLFNMFISATDFATMFAGFRQLLHATRLTSDTQSKAFYAKLKAAVVPYLNYKQRGIFKVIELLSLTMHFVT